MGEERQLRCADEGPHLPERLPPVEAEGAEGIRRREPLEGGDGNAGASVQSFERGGDMRRKIAVPGRP
jgi:hypothetical protein